LTETESTGRLRESKRGGIQYISYVVAEETNWDFKEQTKNERECFEKAREMLVVFVEQQQVME
jgi:hypothetical protein